MKPFTRSDINTTVKVIKVSTQDQYWCSKVGTVVDVHQQAGGCIINVRFGTMSVWFAPESLERGKLVQVWKPEVPVQCTCHPNNLSHEIGCPCWVLPAEPKEPQCDSTTGGECNCPGMVCLVGSR